MTYLIAIAFILLMYCRLYFGVDTSDEGFYMSMSYMFAHGGEPFVNEWVAQQGASVIFYPIVWLYVTLVGSTDGIVLMGRHVYFILAIVAFWCIWRVSRQFLAPAVAIIPALIPIVFHPGAIPNISYNSLGGFGWLIGLTLFFSCYTIRVNILLNISLATIALIFATYAYPSLLPVVALLLGAVFICPPENPEFQIFRVYKRTTRIIIVLSVFVVSTLLLSITIPWGDIKPLLASYEYSSTSSLQGGGWKKVAGTFRMVLDNYKSGALVFSLLIMINISAFPKKLRLYSVILLLVPCYYAIQQIWFKGRLIDSSMLIIWLALLFPVPFLFKKDIVKFKILIIVGFLSIVAGLIVGWTSSVQYNAAIGLMPLAVISLYLWLLPLKPDSNSIKVLPAYLLLVLIAAPQFITIYQESKLFDLNKMIMSGPYKGLMTGWKPASFYSFPDDINEFELEQETIFIYDGHPGYYLMTNLKPVGPTVWANSQGAVKLRVDMIRDYLSKHENQPDVVVVFTNELGDDHPLTAFFLSLNYLKRIERLEYLIYIKQE